VLGGTTEASALADALHGQGARATLSYAGRVARLRAQPVPVRVGGFGGVDGLVRYLRAERVTHLVDATHPFAATMSMNAVAAAKLAGVAHIALVRPAWRPGPGDRWKSVPDLPAAVAALAGAPRRVMLALGRMHVDTFVAQPQHHYVLRFVDPPATPAPLPDHRIVVDRPPFEADSEAALFAKHAIDLIVCKNSGGGGGEAKLIAARRLDLPAVMIRRPVMPRRAEVASVAEVLRWLGHAANLGV